METAKSSWLARVMREAAQKRSSSAEEGAESGFTLIELMVVLLIMAILLAIAIPTFLGVKGSAQDRSAQSDLSNALTAAKAIYTATGSYGSTTASLAASLNSSEPALSFTDATVTNANNNHDISVSVSSDGLVLILATQSASKACWYAEDNEEQQATTAGVAGDTSTQGTQYSVSKPLTAGGCDAGSLPTGLTWSGAFPAAPNGY